MSIAISQIKGKLVSELTETVEKLVDLACASAENAESFDTMERETLAQVLQMGRVAMDGFIRLQGDGDLGEEIQADDGRTLRRSDKPVERVLRSVFGEHRFEAFVYSQGPKRKIEMRPIDARMELPERRHSYLYQEFSQLFCVEQAFNQASKSFETVLGQKTSVDVFEQINREMGAQAGEFLDDLPTPPAEEEGEFLIVTADGKGIPFVKEDAQRLSAVEDKPERPGNRKMATLAAVYTVDPHVRTPDEIVQALFDKDKPADENEQARDRPEPKNKHVTGALPVIEGDAPASSTTSAIGWAADQVRNRRKPDQIVIALTDGQKSLKDACDECLEDVAEVPKSLIVHILDILHVAVYIWRAAKVFHSTKEHQEAFARERLGKILRGQAKSVIKGLRRMATMANLADKDAKEIETVCGYLESNLERMKYDEYLAAGYPIATGVIEGACRHVVKDRFERSGMRWTLEGARGMLHLRAVRASSYWDEFHAARKARETQRLYPYRHQVVSRPPNFVLPV